MKKAFLATLLLLPFLAQAQYPGGISANLRLWLKANSGITVSGGNVAQWNELSGAGVTGNFTTNGASINMGAQNPPAYQAPGINFNPHVSFNTANVNSISSSNAFVGTQMIDPYANTMLQVINLHTMSGTGVWFKWQYLNTNTARLGNEVNNGGANTGKLRFDFRGINNFSNTVITDQYFLAGCATTQSQNIIRLNGANDNVMAYGTQAAFSAPTSSPARVTLGNEEYGDAYPTTIDIAEVILYNRALTAAERNKVESYLAVKYGFTLDQSAASANDYTASNGTVIWTRASNLSYANNITGIGRDDGDSLIQRQSRSINTAGLVTIYHGSYNGGNFPVLNTGNTNNFGANNTYLLFGDNGGTLALDRCVSSNPSFLRMARAWKVQMTGAVSTVTLAVSAGDVPAGTKHLLVSTDTAFTASKTISYRLDSVNGILSKSVILQGGNYFTFASDSLILRPSSNSPLCNGHTILLSANVNGSGTFTWTGPNGYSSNLQNPGIPAATVNDAGTYTVNASVNGCAFMPGSVTVSVSPMPPPPTVIPVFYCTGDTALPLTAAGSNLAWYNVPSGGAIPGVTIPPIPYTGWEGNFYWWVTQSNNGCESIRTKQTVTVRNRPNGIISGTSTVICQGDIDTFSYYGNATVAMQYNWKAPNGRTAYLSGGGQGPVIYRFDSAGATNVRMQVNNEGCVSDEALFTVTVKPRPMARASVPHDVCLDQMIDIALRSMTPGITRMAWDFNGGDIHYEAVPAGPFGISWSTTGIKQVAHTSFSAGCPSFTIIDTVVVHPAPTAKIGGRLPDRICIGDSVLFEAVAGDTADRFTWTPAPFFGGAGTAQSWGLVSRSGNVPVRVQVTSRYGCTAGDSVMVNAQGCCTVSFPDAFTPNGDGRNDRFRILTVGHHEISDFRVVNRWGQTVFETRDEQSGWDGTFNGIPQDMGTYYYYIRFRCNEGKLRDVEQKGDFLLVR